MTIPSKKTQALSTLAAILLSGTTWATPSTATLPAAPQSQTILSLPTTGAPIQRPTTKACTVNITKNFPFDTFGKISEQSYRAPKDCPGPWAKVVLEMNGTIDGAQYDRFGFIHLGQVELLRFTTPEPPHHAINWHVEKDVTQYSSLFANENSQTFTVQLDNAISAKLNGVYRITANLTFYQASKKFSAAPQPNIIKALSTGDQHQPYFSLVSPTVVAAVSNLDLPTNITHAYLEIYATPHDAEEFWYLPGGNAASYREIQVYIDGRLAGIAWPFPYIYTGGFNPHYWTPITAIDALNIPPYIVDITPFAALLNQSSGGHNTHSLSIKLNVTPSNWLIDANLFLETDTVAQTIQGRLTDYHVADAASVANLPNASYLKDYKNKKITRSLIFSGLVKTSTGTVKTTIEQTFSLSNEFSKPAGKEDVVKHLMTQHVTTKTMTKHGQENTITAQQTDYTFLLSPSIDNMNSPLPAPFVIAQTLQNTTRTMRNGVLSSASNLSQKVSSANNSLLLHGDPQNNYVVNANSIYQDSTHNCFTQHLAAAQNKLTVAVTQEKPCH